MSSEDFMEIKAAFIQRRAESETVCKRAENGLVQLIKKWQGNKEWEKQTMNELWVKRM